MPITLKNIKTRAKSASATSGGEPATSDDYTRPSKFGDYFILILEILAGFIVFCWLATSNYLNANLINTDLSYPIYSEEQVVAAIPADRLPNSGPGSFRQFENFGLPKREAIKQKIYPEENPYRSRFFDPGHINMTQQKDITNKIGFGWWWQNTQRSSYETGGFILHKTFDGLKKCIPTLEADNQGVARIFTSALRLMFDIFSVIVFVSFLGLVFLLWIPGWLGGLTAFMPLAYYTNSGIWQLAKKAFILIVTLVLMCLGGWVVTVLPVIWQFFYLIYLIFFKQLRENPGRFGDAFLKRMQSLVYIYILTAVIIAFASSELPDATKITIAVVFGVFGIFWLLSASKTTTD